MRKNILESRGWRRTLVGTFVIHDKQHSLPTALDSYSVCLKPVCTEVSHADHGASESWRAWAVSSHTTLGFANVWSSV